MIIIESRLVNLKTPTLLFDKIDKIKNNNKYYIEFLNLEPEIEDKIKKNNKKFDFTVRPYNNDKFKI